MIRKCGMNYKQQNISNELAIQAHMAARYIASVEIFCVASSCLEGEKPCSAKWENLADINFHWLAHPILVAHLIFTIQWQFSSISFTRVKKIWNLAAFNFHVFVSSAEKAKTRAAFNKGNMLQKGSN